MKYTAHVQITPKLHLGKLQHYWHIDQHTDDGVFSVRHGYSTNLQDAFNKAQVEARLLKTGN